MKIYVLMVYYIDGADFLGCYSSDYKAIETIGKLKLYNKCFGTEERYKVYDVEVNKYYDWNTIDKVEVYREEGNN